jgi:hypothetical protein
MRYYETGLPSATSRRTHPRAHRAPLNLPLTRYHAPYKVGPYAVCRGQLKVTDLKTDLDALVQETMAIAKNTRVDPPMSERDEIRKHVLNFKSHQERLARDREELAASVLKRVLTRS